MDGTISANTVHSISSFSELSDITLVISPSPVLPSHEYLCHKLILKARCPYFKSLFESGCMESTQTKINLPCTFNPPAFKTLLEYIYKGKNKWEELSESTDPPSIRELIYMSNYLCIPELSLHFIQLMSDCTPISKLSPLDLYTNYKAVRYIEESGNHPQVEKLAIKAEERLLQGIKGVIGGGVGVSMLNEHFDADEQFRMFTGAINACHTYSELGGILNEVMHRGFRVRSYPHLLDQLRKNGSEKMGKKISNGEYSLELKVPICNLKRGSVITSPPIKDSNPKSNTTWSIKIRIDESNNIGIYINYKQRGKQQTNKRTHTTHPDTFCNFTTGIYNFQINEQPTVYEEAGIFSFPKGWNYLFGPSKLVNVSDLVGTHVNIKIWVFEDLIHSACMHYVANKFEDIYINMQQEDYRLFPQKDLYSLLESPDLNASSEDNIFKFLGEYLMVNKGEGINDLIRSIRYNYLSPHAIAYGMQNEYFATNSYFLQNIQTQLLNSSDFSWKKIFEESLQTMYNSGSDENLSTGGNYSETHNSSNSEETRDNGIDQTSESYIQNAENYSTPPPYRNAFRNLFYSKERNPLTEENYLTKRRLHNSTLELNDSFINSLLCDVIDLDVTQAMRDQFLKMIKDEEEKARVIENEIEISNTVIEVKEEEKCRLIAQIAELKNKKVELISIDSTSQPLVNETEVNKCRIQEIAETANVQIENIQTKMVSNIMNGNNINLRKRVSELDNTIPKMGRKNKKQLNIINSEQMSYHKRYRSHTIL